MAQKIDASMRRSSAPQRSHLLRNKTALFITHVATFLLGSYLGVLLTLHHTHNGKSYIEPHQEFIPYTSTSRSKCICPEQATDKSNRLNSNQNYDNEVAMHVTETEQNFLQEWHGESDKISISDNQASLHLGTVNPHLSNVVAGAVRVSKEELLTLYDTGIPRRGGQGDKIYDNGKESEALLFYSRTSAMPEDTVLRQNNGVLSADILIPLVGVQDAVKNCDGLNVVYTHNMNRQCLAVVGNYNSRYNGHIFKFQRKGAMKKESPQEQLRHPLVPIGRGVGVENQDNFRMPDAEKVKEHWSTLGIYFNAIDDLTSKLEPILHKIHRDKTVIVMVTNAGHKSLLINFVCSCQARGFDISNLIVFATDKESFHLAEALGVAAFYDDRIFGSIPSTASKQFGDADFKAIVFAKLVAPQLVNMLGFDMLFQDVDVVWNRDPIQLFTDPEGPYKDFDMLFMDDGIRHVLYAPYQANSGFYFAKSTEKTKFFFRQLLYYADNIHKWTSEQGVFGALLPEQASFLGLRIKTLLDLDFPGGFHYHRSKDFIRDIVEGKAHPMIFHMHWTKSLVQKLDFMKQMGLWYVKDKCLPGDLLDEEGQGVTERQSMKQDMGCCSNEALIQCIFYDKGSVTQCKDDISMKKFESTQHFWPTKTASG